MKTANENSRDKYITRTITWYEGTEVTANYNTMTFEEKPMVWYDELDIPKQRAKNVVKHEKLLRMKLTDFIRMAEEIEK